MVAPTSVVPTTLDEVVQAAERERVASGGFSDGYHPSRRNPSAHPYGLPEEWRSSGEKGLRAVGMCRAWIRQAPTRKAINIRAGDSYDFKHSVEGMFGLYIPNGAFIIAAFLEGLQVRRVLPDSPNAYFNFATQVSRLSRAA